MKNKKALIAIVAVLFVVVGATIAYFTNVTTFTNNFTTATYKTTTTETFESPTNWKPGETITKEIVTENEGSIPATVRAKFTGEWTNTDGTALTAAELSDIPNDAVIVNVNTTDWVKDGEYYYYKYIINPDDTTSTFLNSVTLNSTVGNATACTTTGNKEVCESTNSSIQGKKYTLTVIKETIQADAFNTVWNPTTATVVEKPVPLSNDDWSTIIQNAQSGNGSRYELGSTKTIEMDIDNNGTPENYTLRVANNSTPAACSTEGFSQTACGFVLEFADIITTHRMNPYTNGSTNGDGNKGGWEYSEMRTYVNSDIYNALPTELKNAIIDTTVVSGHGSKDSANFTTTDKLYLLSTEEVWGSNLSWDTANAETRQLDYYANLGVTDTSNYSGAIKKYNNSNSWWWLRSAFSSNSSGFGNVLNDGYYNGSNVNQICGVAPAFRIG